MFSGWFPGFRTSSEEEYNKGNHVLNVKLHVPPRSQSQQLHGSFTVKIATKHSSDVLHTEAEALPALDFTIEVRLRSYTYIYIFK